ncbi:hypothetical protein ACOME3_005455 [Neoechinorhynchus agilis]
MEVVSTTYLPGTPISIGAGNGFVVVGCRMQPGIYICNPIDLGIISELKDNGTKLISGLTVSSSNFVYTCSSAGDEIEKFLVTDGFQCKSIGKIKVEKVKIIDLTVIGSNHSSENERFAMIVEKESGKRSIRIYEIDKDMNLKLLGGLGHSQFGKLSRISEYGEYLLVADETNNRIVVLCIEANRPYWITNFLDKSTIKSPTGVSGNFRESVVIVVSCRDGTLTSLSIKQTNNAYIQKILISDSSEVVLLKVIS